MDKEDADAMNSEPLLLLSDGVNWAEKDLQRCR